MMSELKTLVVWAMIGGSGMGVAMRPDEVAALAMDIPAAAVEVAGSVLREGLVYQAGISEAISRAGADAILMGREVVERMPDARPAHLR